MSKRGVIKEDAGMWRWLLNKANSKVVSLTLLKLIVAVIVSLTLNTWWIHSGDNSVVDSCSNPTVGQCHSFCGDLVTIVVPLQDDDYFIVDDAYIPNVNNVTHYSSESYCIADIDSDCAYGYWLLFKLVPILCHVLGFLLQCISLWYYKTFVPQERQYDTIIEYLYPEVAAYVKNESSTLKAAGSAAPSVHYSAMFSDLTLNPLDSSFAFIEVFTTVYVWGELVYPPVYCGPVRPLTLYYYPILMSLLDLTKFNFYVSAKLFDRSRGRSFFALLNVEMFVTNGWTMVVLAILFPFGVIHACLGIVRWCHSCVYGVLFDRSATSLRQSELLLSFVSNPSLIEADDMKGGRPLHV